MRALRPDLVNGLPWAEDVGKIAMGLWAYGSMMDYDYLWDLGIIIHNNEMFLDDYTNGGFYPHKISFWFIAPFLELVKLIGCNFA